MSRQTEVLEALQLYGDWRKDQAKVSNRRFAKELIRGFVDWTWNGCVLTEHHGLRALQAGICYAKIRQGHFEAEEAALHLGCSPNKYRSKESDVYYNKYRGCYEFKHWREAEPAQYGPYRPPLRQPGQQIYVPDSFSFTKDVIEFIVEDVLEAKRCEEHQATNCNAIGCAPLLSDCSAQPDLCEAYGLDVNDNAVALGA